MTRKDWNKRVAAYAVRVTGITDIWAADDPYDVATYADIMYAKGVTPKQFVDDAFADEIAAAEHDTMMYLMTLDDGTEGDT